MPGCGVGGNGESVGVGDVFAVEEDAFGMSELEVDAQVVDHEEADKALEVEMVQAFVVRAIAKRLEGRLPVVENVLHGDVQQGVFLVEVRVVNLRADAVGVVREDGYVVIGVEFEHGRTALIVEIDGVVLQPHLFRQVIAASVGAVDVELYGHDVAGCVASGQGRELVAHGIAEHGARLLVAEQHPVLASLHA